MKKIAVMIFLLTGILLCSENSIELSSSRTSWDIHETSESGFTLELTISALNTETISNDAGEFTRLSVPGFTRIKEPGLPELPLFRKIFTAPTGAEVSVNVISYTTTDYNLVDYGINYPVYPAQPSVSKSQDPAQLEFHFNQEEYLQEGFGEQPLVTLEEAGSVRGNRLLTLNVEPVKYDPVNGKLKIVNEISIEVNFSSSNSSADIYTFEKNYSPYFEAALKGSVINYPLYQPRDELTHYPVKYVIVSDPMFEAQLQPFIEWKIQKGFDVIESYTDDPEVGSSLLSIKAFLQALYDNSSPEDPAPSFLLIVGDVAQIPAWNGNTGGHVTDLNYVKLDSNDYIPEMYFGRFSAANAEQLQPQIDKTIEYEKYLMPDPSYLGNVVMIAGVDSNYAPIYGNGQINYGTNYYFNEAHDINSFTYLYPESGTSDSQIIQNVSDGVSYINYTAHGYDQGWGDPTFTNSDVWNLQNFNQYCLAVGNCCLTNKFDVGTCFGEAWLRAENKGAIGYIGGTNSTYWDEDYWWGVGAGSVNSDPSYDATGIGVYDGLFHDHGEPFSDWHTTSGSMNFCGNMAVVEGGGASSYYWEIYALMGDPSLEAYLGVPDENMSYYPDVIILGQEEIQIYAEPYSYVALTRDSEILATVLIDETGTSNLELDDQVQPGTATLVFTKQNKQPIIAEIELIPDGSYVIIDSYEIIDDNNGLADYGETFSLDLTLLNAGNLPSGELTVIATTEDTYLNIIEANFTVDEIGAEASYTIEEAVTLQLSDAVPDEHEAVITFWITGAATWQSDIQFNCNAPAFSSGALQVEDGDNGALDPGETALIMIPLSNVGQALSQVVEAQLICLTSNVLEINQESVELEGLASGEEVMVEFAVTVYEDQEPGTPVEFIFQAYSGAYSVITEYVSSVGNVVENFETGDFLSYPWQHQGDAGWEISESSFEGNYAAVSGSIAEYEESVLKLEFSIPVNGYLTFWKKISTQPEADKLDFLIDNVLQESWSGELDWSQEIYQIAAGDHELKWRYEKDQTGSAGADAVWLDQIILPSAGITFPPKLHIAPEELNIELTDVDLYETEILVRNIGGGEITFNALVPGTLNWLTLSDYEGTLSSGSILNIAVNIDASELENGEYTGAIMFNCDNGDFIVVPVYLMISDTGTDDNEFPLRTGLLGNYPNPFNPTTTISFNLNTETSENTELVIYNIKGQITKTFESTQFVILSGFGSDPNGVEGRHSVIWNGTDDLDQPVSSGIYFYRIESNDLISDPKKMILLK